MSGKNLKLEVILAAIDRVTRPLKAISAGSKGVSKALSETRDQLRQLDRSQKMLGDFKDISRGLAVTKHRLGGAMEKLRGLKEQMAQTENPTKQMTAALKAAQSEADGLRLRHGKLVAQEAKLKASMAAAGLGTTKLTDQQRQLKTQAEALNGTLVHQQREMDKLNKAASRMHAARARYDKQMQTRDKVAGAGVAMGVAGAATGAAVAIPVRAFMEAEDTATQLKVAMMGAGGVVSKQFADVNALAEKLGNKLPGTTSDFQDMMRILIQKGLPATAVLNGAGEATANLAILAKVSFSESADAISVFQDSMGVADKDMVAAADQMQRLYNVGMKIPDIQEGFKAMGPALSYVKKGGIDAVKALAPLLAITDAAGMDAGSAGNAYNKIIRGSVDKKKVDKSNALLQGTGIKLNFVDAKGNFAGVDNMVNQIMKIQGLSDQKRKTIVETIFGSDKEVAEALNALGKAGNPGIEAMRKKLADQASMQERINAQLGTLKNLWDAASGTFVNTLVKFGEAIAPELKMACDWINNAAEAVGKWAKEHPQLSNAIMKTLAIVAVLLTVMGGLALALATVLGPLAMLKLSMSTLGISLTSGVGIIGKLGGSLGWLKTVFMGVGRAFMLNPIGLAIAGIAIAALLIYKYWEPIKAFVSGIFEGMSGALDPLINAFSGIGQAFAPLKPVLADIGKLFSSLFSQGSYGKGTLDGWASAGRVLGSVLGWLVSAAITPLSLSIRALIFVLGYMASAAASIWGQIRTAFSGGITGISALIINWSPLGLFYSAFAGVLNWFGVQLPATFTGFGGMIIDGLINGLSAKWEAVKAKASEIANSISTTVKGSLGIHSPSRVFAEIGGHTMDGLAQGLSTGQQSPLNTVSKFAKTFTAAGAGLVLSAGTAMAGNLDMRPAMGNTPAALSSAASASATPATAGAQINITINAAPGMDEQKLAQLVAKEIERLERSKAARGRAALSDRD